MNTTEIFIEQVFIGAMALLVVLLPFAPEILAWLPGLETADGVALGTLLIGLAYVLGIVFDRVADTLTDDLERHHRARFVSHLATRSKTQPWPEPWRDPFEEDRLRVLALRGAEAEVDQLDYYRVRMRLARALAVYAPALTFAMVLGLMRGREVECAAAVCVPMASQHAFTDDLLWWMWVLPAAYLGVLLFTWIRWEFPDKDNGAVAPRTYDGAEVKEYAMSRGYLNDDGSIPATKDRLKRFRALARDVFFSRFALAWLVIAIATTTVIVERRTDVTLWVVALAGLGLALMSAWAWWRISHTFMTFVRDRHRFK